MSFMLLGKLVVQWMVLNMMSLEYIKSDDAIYAGDRTGLQLSSSTSMLAAEVNFQKSVD